MMRGLDIHECMIIGLQYMTLHVAYMTVIGVRSSLQCIQPTPGHIFIEASPNGRIMENKNVLIVFGHHERHSPNGNILDTAIETLETQGHNVVVSDLYNMGFNPVLGRHDVKGAPAEDQYYSAGVETLKAYEENRMATDIKTEQDKIQAADLIIFQFPLYWMTFPAIMKGWFDRVLSPGFAFEVPHKLFENGGLKGKMAVLSFTVGSPKPAYSSKGIMGDMEAVLWTLQNGCLRFVGFDVLAPNIMYGMDNPSSLEEFTKGWAQRLKNIFREQPIQFLKQHDYEGGLVVKEEIVRQYGTHGENIGQHFGLKVPEGKLADIPPSEKNTDDIHGVL